MNAKTPEDISRLFQKRVAAGDVDSVMELYDPEAVFVDEKGRSTRALGEVLAQLMATRPQMTFRTFRLVETDGIALMHTDWTRDGQTMPALEVGGNRTAPGAG